MTKERPSKATLFIYLSHEEKAMVTEASFIARKNRSTFSREAILKEAKRLIEQTK